MPANLAAVLYNNTKGQVEVLAVNTLGVLYIVESGESVSSVADLRGRTIYASGKGATPEYALNYILSENGVDPEKDVNIEWKSEHAECLAALLAEENAVAMLPQPFVTTAQMKNDKIKVRLDLNAEWDAVQAGSDAPSQLITGVVAEVIGMPVPSIGERLQQAKVYLDTPELFAWTLVIVLISVGFEKLFMAALGALERRLTRL